MYDTFSGAQTLVWSVNSKTLHLKGQKAPQITSHIKAAVKIQIRAFFPAIVLLYHFILAADYSNMSRVYPAFHTMSFWERHYLTVALNGKVGKKDGQSTIYHCSFIRWILLNLMHYLFNDPCFICKL